MLVGTALPICTVTVMVCGASTALASLTVTMPVTDPAGRAEVFRVNWSGMQLPGCDEQARCAPTVPAIHGTDEVSFRLSAPSATLYASTVCVCKAPPLAPWAMETGPTVDETSRNRGAAPRPAAKKKPAATSTAVRLWVKPTQGLPFYKPKCNRRPG